MEIVKLEGCYDMIPVPTLSSKTVGIGQDPRDHALSNHWAGDFSLPPNYSQSEKHGRERAFLLSHATPAKMAKGSKPHEGLAFQLKRTVSECSHMFV